MSIPKNRLLGRSITVSKSKGGNDPNKKTVRIDVLPSAWHSKHFRLSKPRIWLGNVFLYLGEAFLKRKDAWYMTARDFYSHVRTGSEKECEIKSKVVDMLDQDKIGILTMGELTHYPLTGIKRIWGMGENTYEFMVRHAKARGIILKPWK